MKPHALGFLFLLVAVFLSPENGRTAEPPAHLKGLTKLSPKRVDLDYQMSLLCRRPTNPRKPSPHSKSSILVYGSSQAIDYRRAHPKGHDYPVGTTFLKEKYANKETKQPHLATVMKRVGQKGDIGDWNFSTISLPNGKGMPLSKKDAAACTDCHEGFEDRGYLSRYTESLFWLLLNPPQKENTPAKGANRPHVDSKGFLALGAEAEKLREERLLSAKDFARIARMRNTLILDARSRRAFDGQHIAGAVNLPYTDFTPETLAEVIPSKDMAVLIYCSNNINYPQHSQAGETIRVGGGFKGKTAALNIPTFITLYGYGYRNLYELGPVVDPRESVIKWADGD